MTEWLLLIMTCLLFVIMYRVSKIDERLKERFHQLRRKKTINGL